MAATNFTTPLPSIQQQSQKSGSNSFGKTNNKGRLADRIKIFERKSSSTKEPK